MKVYSVACEEENGGEYIERTYVAQWMAEAWAEGQTDGRRRWLVIHHLVNAHEGRTIDPVTENTCDSGGEK